MKTSARTIILAALCGVALSGCSWLKEWPPSDQPEATPQAAMPPPPQQKLMQTANGTWLQPAPGADVVEVKVPQNGESPETLTRINELEKEVDGLRNQMSMMLPAMTKLAETQAGMQGALQQTLSQAQAAAAANAAAANPVPDQPATPVADAGAMNAVSPQAGGPDPDDAYMDNRAPQALAVPPAAQPPMPPAVAPQAVSYPVTPDVPGAMAAAGTSGTVSQIRFGQHADKTRIVLDSPQALAYSYDVDNGEHLLVVNLPGTGWGGTAQDVVAQSPYISSYKAVPDGAGGTTLVIQLQVPARVAMAQALPPGAGKGHRLVLDIAPL